MTKRITRKRHGFAWPILCACLFAILIAPRSQAAVPADWKPELLPATGSMREPTEPIRIAVPALSTDKLEPLVLELDGFDVTRLVAREPDRLVFKPPQPPAWGQHQLRLVERAANGEILERGKWTLEIRKSSAFREARLQSNMVLSVTQRTSNDDLTPPTPARDLTAGAAQFQGVLPDADW